MAKKLEYKTWEFVVYIEPTIKVISGEIPIRYCRTCKKIVDPQRDSMFCGKACKWEWIKQYKEVEMILIDSL